MLFQKQIGITFNFFRISQLLYIIYHCILKYEELKLNCIHQFYRRGFTYRFVENFDRCNDCALSYSISEENLHPEMTVVPRKIMKDGRLLAFRVQLRAGESAIFKLI